MSRLPLSKGKHTSTNIIERVQGTLKERTKVMRGLKTLDSMKAFLKGWAIHYNYFRPHLSLNDRTPAQKAGIKFPYANWKELIEKQSYQVTAKIPVKCDVRDMPHLQSVRITEPKPRQRRVRVKSLGSVKRGRVYHTKIGSGTVLSRRPLRRRK